MNKLQIFHYEDEPTKVDFHGMIEVALYSHSDFCDVSLEENDDESKSISIKYEYNKKKFELHYHIEENIDDILKKSDCGLLEPILHLVDMSIGADEQAGVSIVKTLKREGVENTDIWMVTAYEAKARSKPELADIEVYPKPSPLEEMTEKVIAKLLDRTS